MRLMRPMRMGHMGRMRRMGPMNRREPPGVTTAGYRRGSHLLFAIMALSGLLWPQRAELRVRAIRVPLGTPYSIIRPAHNLRTPYLHPARRAIRPVAPVWGLGVVHEPPLHRGKLGGGDLVPTLQRGDGITTLRRQGRAGAGCPPTPEQCARIRYRGEPGQPFLGRGASIHCVPTRSVGTRREGWAGTGVRPYISTSMRQGRPGRARPMHRTDPATRCPSGRNGRSGLRGRRSVYSLSITFMQSTPSILGPAKRAVRPVAQSDQRELWELPPSPSNAPEQGRLFLC